MQFIGEAYIRVGTYTKKLSEHPTLHRQLWRALDATPYEVQLASAPMDTGSLMQALDYESYYGLQGSQVPPTADILENFLADKLIEEAATAKFSVTNLGALLFANDLRQFPYIERKAARVIKYQGLTKAIAEREVEGRRGYASGFQGLVGFVNDLLPARSV